MSDITRMRVSDAERLDVIARLQDAAAEGRLDLDEMSDRIAEAYAAKTWSDLDRLVDDLPEAAEPEPEPESASPVSLVSALSATIAALGVASAVLSFWTALGVLLGMVTVVAGAFLFTTARDRMSTWERLAVLAGMVTSLLPAIFFLTLLLILM
jgi:hypothetical protein